MTSQQYEAGISALLADLSEVQEDLLDHLTSKRSLLATGDRSGLEEMQQQADSLVARLSECHARREKMLLEAAEEGLPTESLQTLVTAVAPSLENDGVSGDLGATVTNVRERTRLLQHQSLTNWVIVQRSLLHLSQMIEIFATGGRGKPTYGNRNVAGDSGALVDRAV